MAEADGEVGGEAGIARMRKRPRRPPHTKRNSARRDAERCAELHSKKSRPASDWDPERGFVYLMTDCHGAVKVGCSYQLWQRLREVRQFTPRNRHPITLIRAVEVPRYLMRTVERAAHKRLSRYLQPYQWEWFDVKLSTASRALSGARNQARRTNPHWLP